MEYLDPNYSKKHTRMLFLGYALIGILIIMVTTLFVLESQGYYINQGQIIQNSLVVTDSSPGSARVYVDGIQDGETAKRLKVPEGEHNIEIIKDGYRRWNKTLNFIGGKVEYLSYPLLIPNRLEPVQLETYQLIPEIYHNSNAKQIAIVEELETGTAQLSLVKDYDFQNTEIISITQDQSGAGISIVDWAEDLMLVLVESDTSKEYVVIDISDNNQVNTIELRARAEPKQLSVATDNSLFILYDDGQLHLADVGQEAAPSSVLATDVDSYDNNKDKLLYTRHSTAADSEEDIISTSVYMLEDLVEYTLLEVSGPAGLPHIMISEYDGDDYVSVVSADDGRIRIYKNPLQALAVDASPEIVSNAPLSGVSKLGLSVNNRSILAIHEGGQFIFDLRDALPFRAQLPAVNLDTVMWVGDHHLAAVDSNNQLVMWEFDGKNQVVLGEYGQHSLLFEHDREFFISLKPLGSGTVLEMIDLSPI
ncbi:MAG: PEGA domain-containing protein [Patescibacteria group bacterium]